ncbi:MAG: HAMP domain-containing sensor histidine kinase [Actinomycetales bacterium]|nr:HAMP domain-containing sensor histidine kinase [Actinomycetales bacterium]
MRVALTSAVLAVALFALPLAIAAQRIYLGDAQVALERTALRTAVSIGPDFAGRDPAELPGPRGAEQLGLYDQGGRRVGGSGPDRADAATTVALGGGVGQNLADGWVIVSVPVSSGEQVVGAVRTAAPVTEVWRRTALTWAAMVLAAALAIGIAILAARVLARRVNRPLEQFALTAHRLGDGDFDVRTTPTGMPEIDDAGTSLNATAERIGDLVRREQQIAANASHQLRTPLSGLRASLESALADPAADLAAAARAAISSADRLELTIADLVALTRGVPASGESLSVEMELDQALMRWSGPLAAAGRPLRLRLTEDVPQAACSRAGLAQILDVLVDNALRHGAGAVTVTLRTAATAVAIDVADEGHGISSDVDIFARGMSGQGGSGIGLAFARGVAEDNGGRLRLSQREPTTRFTLLLPLAER